MKKRTSLQCKSGGQLPPEELPASGVAVKRGEGGGGRREGKQGGQEKKGEALEQGAAAGKVRRGGEGGGLTPAADSMTPRCRLKPSFLGNTLADNVKVWLVAFHTGRSRYPSKTVIFLPVAASIPISSPSGPLQPPLPNTSGLNRLEFLQRLWHCGLSDEGMVQGLSYEASTLILGTGREEDQEDGRKADVGGGHAGSGMEGYARGMR